LNGKYAIWYNLASRDWRVGPEKRKGTTWAVFYDNSVLINKCPHQPDFVWKYWVEAQDKWIDADFGMTIYEI